MIRGIGCDLIEIERFRTAMGRSGDALLQRLFTPNEIAYCYRHKDPVFCLAGRFAAKEALSKALGVGIGAAIGWLDMEIVNDEQGKPSVIWHVDVKERFGVAITHISISHSHSAAMAYAILEAVRP